MSDNFILQKNQTTKDKIPGNIFVRLELDRKRCFIGEPVVATFKLYTRLKSESKIVKRPNFNGFSVYDMASPDFSESNLEIYNGKQFNVYILRKVQLYALQSGIFTLDPMEVENELSFLKMMYKDKYSSLDDYLGRSGAITLGQYSMIREKVNTASRSEVIRVDPLPDPIPVDFNGSVGSFRIKIKIMEDTIHVNDLVHMKILISGKGNFPVINSPKIDWGNDFDVFEPEVNENFDLSVSPIAGSKVYTFPFVPKKEGNIKLPGIFFHYFDPQKKSFRLDSIKSAYISILPAKPEIQGKQIEDVAFSPRRKFIFLFFLLCIGIFLGIYFYRSGKMMKDRSSPILSEQSGPVLFIEENIALDRLKKLMERGEAMSFYKHAVDAIDHYLMIKYGIVWPVDNKVLGALKKQQKDQLLALVVMKERFEGFLYAPMLSEPDLISDFITLSKLMKG